VLLTVVGANHGNGITSFFRTWSDPLAWGLQGSVHAERREDAGAGELRHRRAVLADRQFDPGRIIRRLG